jgi:hypothetical protein
MSLDLGLDPPLRVINLGLEIFAQDLATQDVAVVHVDWRPPAGAVDVAELLAQLDDDAS